MHSRNVYKVNYGVPFFESPTFYIGALLIMYSFLSGYGIFIFLFGGLLIITLDFVLRSFIIRRPYLYLVQILVLVILSISLFSMVKFSFESPSSNFHNPLVSKQGIPASH